MADVLCPVMVGRQAELAALDAALTAALAGAGRLMFVAGEPGIGKSRLAREMAERARAAGARVVTGRAVPAGQRVLGLATGRDEPATALLDLARRLQGRRAAGHLALARLDGDQVAAMVLACLPPART